MKTIQFVLLLSFISGVLASQSTCFEGETVAIFRQSQLDSLRILYPDCTEVKGTLQLAGNDIVSLEPLGQFTTVHRMMLSYLGKLEDFSGMETVKKIDTLQMLNMAALTSLQGLENVVEMRGNFAIHTAPALENIEAIGGLKIMGGVSINAAPKLENVDALNGLEESGYLSLNNCPGIKKIPAFSNLIRSGGISISYLDSLQAIDGFQAMEHINGPVYINNNFGLVKIDMLNKVDTVSGSIIIKDNRYLDSLFGFEKLVYCEGLELRGPNIHASNIIFSYIPSFPALQWVNGEFSIGSLLGLRSVVGFNNFEYCKNFRIGNPRVEKIEGFTKLKVVEFDFSIPNNYQLIAIHGFTSLTKTRDFHLGGNDNLKEINAFGNLVETRSLDIRDHVFLEKLNCFSSLKRVKGRFLIQSNPQLKEVGFPMLEEVGVKGDISFSGFIININRKIADLNSFSKLNKVVGDLWLWDLPLVSSISALNHISYEDIHYLRLVYLKNVDNCAIKPICDFLILGGNDFEFISGNSVGCNSKAEIISQCITGTTDPLPYKDISLYPNPATDRISIQSKDADLSGISILTADGIMLDRGAGNGGVNMDISDLRPGVYYISAQLGGKTVRLPFVKL